VSNPSWHRWDSPTSSTKLGIFNSSSSKLRYARVAADIPRDVKGEFDATKKDPIHGPASGSGKNSMQRTQQQQQQQQQQTKKKKKRRYRERFYGTIQ